MKELNRTHAVAALALFSAISCKNDSNKPPAAVPNPQTTNSQPNPAPASNQPPLVGAVSAVSVVQGQYLAGVLTADDPDKAQGDSISRIEFSTSPELQGLNGIQLAVGTGDRHNYSLLTPSSPGIPTTVGTFTVYDSRGGSTRSSFPITFIGSSGLQIPVQGNTANTATYCAVLSQALKLNGLLATLLPVACNIIGSKL